MARFMVYSIGMRHRPYKFMTFFLALLLTVSAWGPMSGRAEAQMRCVGASPRSAPCARAELPAVGLTEKQVYGTLMFCCRSRRSGCAMMQDCPMRHTASNQVVHRSTFSARRCLVSIRVATVPTTLVLPRARWLLTAAPGLAPPIMAQALVLPAQSSRPTFWTYSPVLSPHAAPHLRGLRAPPAA